MKTSSRNFAIGAIALLALPVGAITRGPVNAGEQNKTAAQVLADSKTAMANAKSFHVVGHDGQSDLAAPNGDLRREHQHEAELKLILSSNRKDWNISENFISEKDLGHAPWEFGYAVGVTHPLRSAASGRECTFCAEKFIAGAEGYGGLGDTFALTMRDTSHYIAPLIGWQLPKGVRFSFSPGFGLTSTSLARVYRVGVAFEFEQVGRWFHSAKVGGQ